MRRAASAISRDLIRSLPTRSASGLPVHLADPRSLDSRPLSEWQRLSIVTPVHVWENVVPPFTVAQKFFVKIVCHKLIVQTVEASKVIERALSRVFECTPGFHEKFPIT